MKIIQVNKFFYPQGGADRVFLDTINLLEQAGHKVAPFAMQSERNQPTKYGRYFVSYRNFSNPRGLLEKIKVAGRMIYSYEAKQRFARLVNDFQPDIVHIHNIYHQISPSILSVCQERKIPVVMTAHDWFLINPNYTRYARGSRQTEVARRYLWRYVFERGIQDSFLKTLYTTCVHTLQHVLGFWIPKIDQIICPGEFIKAEFMRAGLPKEKLVTIFNPIQLFTYSHELDQTKIDNITAAATTRNVLSKIIFFGRLEKEKGVDTILQAAELTPSIEWELIGEGTQKKNLQKQIAKKNLENVCLTSRLENKALWSRIFSAAVVIVPSEWLEIAPLTVAEAQLAGLPVIASKIGGIQDMIENSKTGFLIPPQDPKRLAEKARWVLEHPEEAEKIAQAGQKFAQEKYNPKKYVEQLEKVYREVISKCPNF